jgi:hypothetical protein
MENEKVEVKTKKKSIYYKIYTFIFWVLIIGLAAVWTTDFIRVKNSDSPMFCIKNNIEYFDDGSVKICNGVGYNVYEYNRKSIDLKMQFSPFFIGMKEK